MSSITSPLIINEVFPNPNSGKEWVEIYYLEEAPINAADYVNFTISDENKIIYSFRGEEIWSDNFLVIEVSGLNNDKDSVILKNAQGIIIDEMSYTSTQKGLSWLRTNSYDSVFVLGEASPLYQNPVITPSATPSPSNPSPSPLINPTISPSSNTDSLPIYSIDEEKDSQINANAENKSIQTVNKKMGKTSEQVLQKELSQTYFANYQNYHNLQITYSKDKLFPQSRLVFLGQEILKQPIINAIIGSSLLVIAAILLSYEAKRKK